MFQPLTWSMLRAGIVAGVVFLAGCCTSSKPPANNNGAPVTPVVQTKGPKTYALGELLVKPGSYLPPPLDNGLIEIAPPQGWVIGSPQIGIVAWFHRFPDSKLLPQMRITAEGVPVGALTDATKDNVQDYCKWLSDYVKNDLRVADSLIIEPVRPLILGENAFGRFVLKARYNNANAERHILITSHGGRIYTLEQYVVQDGLSNKEVRDAAYAVAASYRYSPPLPEAPTP